MRKSKPVARYRAIAFNNQAGRCCYCKRPMWLNSPSELTSRYRITAKQARRLRCTGEHLLARIDGGAESQSNIAAACEYCNLHRHKRKRPLGPIQYEQLVQHRISEGRWHQLMPQA